MNKSVAKPRRSLDNTIADAIAAGTFTREEFAAESAVAAEALAAEEAAYARPVKPTAASKRAA